ncbi:DHA2 family efflux MFS transporter permease subunit [Pasteurellaceae bacterium LIM206]|nr:DHA2 family efflux MFS transporter permease subunit [Pasteurellaceae bacterium LIM206]
MQQQNNYKSLAWIAATALFMQSLDATILNTALPAIAADLHQPPLEMQLAIISYALTVALFIPVSGWLADKYGTLSIFRLAVILFVLGSVACAMSSSLPMLVMSRILQGIGGSIMMPVARLAIIRVVPKTQLLPVWNMMATAGLTGPVVGPILGGWLVTHASWHWIFLINIPIGVLGIALATRYMPNVRWETSKLDWTGFWLFGGGLVGVTLGLDMINEAFFTKWQASAIVLVGALFLMFYCFYAKGRGNSALVPLSLFRIRTFSIGMAANLLIRLSASGIPFLLPLMFQLAFHYPADKAGMLIAPIAASSILVKPISGRIIIGFGYKNTLIGTALLLSVSIGLMSFLSDRTPLWLLIANVALYGGCVSLIYTAVNTLTVGDLDNSNASAGSTMLSVVQQVGIGLGIAVSSIILMIYRYRIGESGEQLERAFSYTYFTSIIFGVLLVAVLLRLKAGDGAQLHKK